MVRSGHSYRIDRFVQLLQHFAEILVLLRFKIGFARFRRLVLELLELGPKGSAIDVAKGDHIRAQVIDRRGVAPAFASDSDASDVDFFIEVLAAQKSRRADDAGPNGQRGSFKKVTTCQLGRSNGRIFIRHGCFRTPLTP